jgi:[citrate (pro-3S)-lyase] ligase
MKACWVKEAELVNPIPDFAAGAVGSALFDRPALSEARELIESQGLRFEPEFDDLVGLFEDGQLIACGARAGYVLKMLAIAPSHQGTDALGGLVTKLILSAISAGHDTVFVFTSPQNVSSFEALNFRLLVTHGQAALLEHGPGLADYLATHASQIAQAGQNGAVVINGNPFTLGHLHLVEHAAQRVDRLYLFVVREDRSVFPFSVRLRLAQEATAHLRNVTILDTSRYAVSAGTFPAYFLKRYDEVASAQMQIDLRLFAQRIAPGFRIARRFVGEEPQCEITAAYNRMMVEVLHAYSIDVVELPRILAGGLPISASRVRKAWAVNDVDTLRALVPPATLEFLQSPQARPIAERLRSEMEEA